MKLRIVVAEDAVLFREGLVRLLEEAGHDVIAAVGDAVSLVEVVDADPPDLAVIDVRMPPDLTDDGVRAAREMRGRHPGLPMPLRLHRDASVNALTERERDVLDLVAQGLTNSAVARQLFLSDEPSKPTCVRSSRSSGSRTQETTIGASAPSSPTSPNDRCG